MDENLRFTSAEALLQVNGDRRVQEAEKKEIANSCFEPIPNYVTTTNLTKSSPPLSPPSHSPTHAPLPQRTEETSGLVAEEEKPTTTSPDQVLAALGSCNLYLLFIWVSMSLGWCLSAMPMMVSSFTMGEKQIYCPVSADSISTTGSAGHSSDGASAVEHQQQHNMEYGKTNAALRSLVGTATTSTYSVNRNCTLEVAPSITNGTYSAQFHSVTVPLPGTLNEDFDLSGSLVGWAAHSAFLMGTCTGSAILSLASDRYGRRMVLVASVAGIGAFGAASAAAPTLPTFILLRFLTGIFFTGCANTNWVLAYESVPLRLRSHTALVFGMMWVLGYCVVGPLAYLLPDWRTLTLACSLPSLVFAVLFYFTLPESFHYLIWRGCATELDEWIHRANHFGQLTNRPRVSVDLDSLLCSSSSANSNDEHKCRTHSVTLPPLIEGGLGGEKETPKRKASTSVEEKHHPTRREESRRNGNSARPKSLFRHLAESRRLAAYTAVMVYLWSCNTFVYYGLSIFSDQLVFNRYWKYVLIGAVEVPSYVVTPTLLEVMGRRSYIVACHLLAAVSLLAIESLFPHWLAFNLTMWLVGKFAIASSFTSLFIYASELFPTEVRNGCIGMCSVAGQVAGAVTPVVMWMAWLNPLLPTLFYSGVLATAAALTLPLPETHNRELLDATDEIDQPSTPTARRK